MTNRQWFKGRIKAPSPPFAPHSFAEGEEIIFQRCGRDRVRVKRATTDTVATILTLEQAKSCLTAFRAGKKRDRLIPAAPGYRRKPPPSRAA